MKLKNFRGKVVYKNCNKYRINWEKKERSKFQTEVKNFLRPYIEKHIVYSEFPVFGTLLKIDIFDATLFVAFEISGRQHQKFIPYFAKTRMGFANQIKRDMEKAKFCELNSIRLCEIFPEDMPLNLAFFKEKYNLFL